ncbi:DUF262 domain-containing protein [Hymenobacter persicinus]|uniref:DUF262 domain-containing protein n=1 Tax=Hymenobacter persicinus TaxID=2025506 RepID=A0A4Q5LHI7_9BACT|nr:DUF262 domain-containing protein [Hymenobacter persicinus]RYU83819.1 DUF262 domain-containing protein [Hymenobacter persicinus]
MNNMDVVERPAAAVGRVRKSVAEIISVRQLLAKPNLRIPLYQRPYKWSLQHVGQLLDDVLQHKGKSAYRLGTVVLHQDEDGLLNLVDGQQRTVTLGLVARALYELRSCEGDAQAFKPDLSQLRFTGPVSRENLHRNYQAIRRRIGAFDEATTRFFFERCEVVLVVIDDLSEAFQFFDSQNARGKELAPHDLLKAFHLREMGHLPEAVRMATVQPWQDADQQDLARLFHDYLFRIRNWAKGRPARDFTRADVAVFKGVNLQGPQTHPHERLHRMADVYVAGYRQHPDRQIDGQQLAYPFQLDQTVVDGQRFFELVTHYQAQVAALCHFKQLRDQLPETSTAHRILTTLDQYEGHHRTGDQYVRMLFECALLYYVDRFGHHELSRAIEVLFVWAYRVRLELQSVRLASIDNNALQGVQMFQLIREALAPHEVLAAPLPPVVNAVASRVESLKELFKQLHYEVS